MIIRSATQSDISAVADIYGKIHDAEQTGKASTGWVRGVYPTISTAESALGRNDLFVAEEDGIIVGSAVLNQIQMDCYPSGNWEYPCDDSQVMVMHTLSIDPLMSRKGYGRAFVKFYEGYAKDHGCTVLRIDTQERNSCGRALYKSCGFKEVGIVPCVFNGIPGVQLVLLEKPVL